MKYDLWRRGLLKEIGDEPSWEEIRETLYTEEELKEQEEYLQKLKK